MDENNQNTVEFEEDTKTKKSSVSSNVKVDENDPSPIDFSNLDALANTEFEKEDKLISMANSFIETCLSVGLFLLSLLLDVFKALWQIIKGFFLSFYYVGRGIGRYFRKLSRMWREGDGSVKASFFLAGFGNFRRGQIVDGVIFCLVEVGFILFLATSGINNLINLIWLGEGSRADLPQGHPAYSPNGLDHYASIQALILGLVTIIAIILYFLVHNAAIRSAYDAYVINENYRFLTAKQDALRYVQNIERFATTYRVEEKTTEEGEIVSRRMVFLSPGKLRAEMRNVYGFSHLSSLYVSYIRPNRLNPHIPSDFERIVGELKENYATWYRNLADKANKSTYASIFGKYLTWKPKAKKPTTGFDAIENELKAAINQHRHTYDKYNRYNPRVRDAKNLLAVLDKPELLEDAIFARDEISRSNGLEEVPFENANLNPKVVASRVVGAFECSYEAALQASKLYVKCYQQAQKNEATNAKNGNFDLLDAPLSLLAEITAQRHEKLDGFIEKYDVKASASREGMRKAFASYSTLRSAFDEGKNVFCDCCQGEFAMTKEDALIVYGEYRHAIRVAKDEEQEIIALLAQKKEQAERLEANYKVSPLFGEPIRFKKKAKQYLDEKFAVTVLSLPVLGAAIFSVLPLFFSIIVAFTNYNNIGDLKNGYLGIFDWSWASFEGILGLGNGSSLLPTFGYVLGWTLIWAFFATFLNYIFGIVLALLINNKHIKLKKMWRTFFVISIAIPQFITLLVMANIFADYGPIANWFVKLGWIEKPNNFWLKDPSNQAFLPKLMLILINCWVGIPYTMLSTTGILMNIPEDLYESARIDGASPWKQFWKITMPYILFVTGPSLLTTFIGNINNFNVIFFLTGGGPVSGPSAGITLGADAQMTDLLITWLYRMTVNNPNPKYGLGSVIGIMIFVICAFFSLIMYKRLGSTQNEEAFQ